MGVALVVALVLFHPEDLAFTNILAISARFAITGAAVYPFNIETEANVHFCDS